MTSQTFAEQEYTVHVFVNQCLMNSQKSDSNELFGVIIAPGWVSCGENKVTGEGDGGAPSLQANW